MVHPVSHHRENGGSLIEYTVAVFFIALIAIPAVNSIAKSVRCSTSRAEEGLRSASTAAEFDEIDDCEVLGVRSRG